MVRLFGRKRPERRAAEQAYAALVAHARAPSLYGPGRVPDTVEGRFEAIALHVALVLRRLRGRGEDAALLSQALFEVMFADLDAALREIGVGDLVVGKRIRRMGEAFYGRAQAYDDALDARDAARLTEALARNLYVDAEPDPATLEATAAYVRASLEALEAQPLEALLRGEEPRFAPAP